MYVKTAQLIKLNLWTIEVLAQAAKEEAIRNKLLKSGNLKIRWDRQGKHILGKHNYDPKKSTLTHSDLQNLVNKYAGTGRKVGTPQPGTPGYKEIKVIVSPSAN